MKSVLTIENLTYTYSIGTPMCRNAVENINFSVMEGEFLGIIGHTGSGKSTFIQHLNGLLKPTNGRVLFDGEDIWQSPQMTQQIRFKVGLVFQYPEYQLFEETVYKDISFGPKNMKLSAEEIDRRVRDAAQFVGLDEKYLEASPFELSGGQKRRVAIAGVIAMEPQVLILDEPTAGLDPIGCETIMNQIREYHKTRGTTIILVSHSMDEIAANADRVAVFHKSHIEMDGTPHQIFARAKELQEIGLDVPQITQVASLLKDKGLAIDAAVYTVEELKKQLISLRGGANNA